MNKSWICRCLVSFQLRSFQKLHNGWRYRMVDWKIPWGRNDCIWLQKWYLEVWFQGVKFTHIWRNNYVKHFQIWTVQYWILGKVNSRPTRKRVSGPDCERIGCGDLWSYDGRWTKNRRKIFHWLHLNTVHVPQTMDKYKGTILNWYENRKKRSFIMMTPTRTLWKLKFIIIRTQCKFG